MEYEKMLYVTNAAQMPQSQTLAPSTFKLGEVGSNQYLPASEQYAAYADNFDLSLLPQDNIPTTVYQYSNSTSINNNNNNSSSSNSDCDNNKNNNKFEPPQIKIEEAWCVDIKQEQPYSLLYDNQQQHQQQLQQQQQNLPTYTNKANNQLIPPPPAYPHIYPSPQSSPAQSDYSVSFASAQFGGYYDSLSSSRTSLYASSPCPSLDASCIKQELHILPPSPPESNCETPSPRSSCSETIKAEPLDAEVERLIDLNTLLLEKSYVGGAGGGDRACNKQQQQQQPSEQQQQQDHQVLREYLEDTTFQKKHNLKPLALESFIGGLAEVRGDFEPVISLALEYAKREADAICAKLQISQDPSAWTPPQVHAWLRSTIAQFKLPQCDSLELKFCENGAALMLLSEEEFMRRLPESGSTLHAQLEIWKMAYADGYQPHNPNANEHNAMANVMQMQEPQAQAQPQTSMQSQPQTQTQPTQPTQTPGLWPANYMQMDLNDDSEDEADRPETMVNNVALPLSGVVAAAAGNAANGSDLSMPATTAATAATTPANTAKRSTGARTGGSHIHLWQFLKELLAAPHVNGTAIRWIDRSKGIFKIEDSVRVAKLWGRRKNRPAMNYDKLSRSIRQYYKKGIMKKTERSQRLVYQFCHPYHQ